jgi:hypothetical protein
MSQKVEEALLKGLRTQTASPRNSSPRKQNTNVAQERSNPCLLQTEPSVA